MSTILEPSKVTPYSTDTDDEKTYLLYENYLSEFKEGGEDVLNAARENLDIYAKDAVFTKEQTAAYIYDILQSTLASYPDNADLQQAILEAMGEVEGMGFLSTTGGVLTGNVQLTVAPEGSTDLVPKYYVDDLITAHSNALDPHGDRAYVDSQLVNYAKVSDSYTSSELYTKKEMDSLLSEYVKRDGSVSFTAAVSGMDPSLPSHLATLRYVMDVMNTHKSETDAHGFVTLLNKYLSNYYTKSETYTKSQTYSRSQLTEILQSQMEGVIDQKLKEYSATEGSVSELRTWIEKQLTTCIKADGSVSHYEPQVGVPAVELNQFITLEQLQEVTGAIDSYTNALVWIPSGPVQSTVGHVEDNTVMPSSMTLQQVCDAIFYGKLTTVEFPEYSGYGEEYCFTIKTHSLGTLESVYIYKDGVLVGTVYPQDFTQSDEGGLSYVYCTGEEFTEDTDWKIQFNYPDGEEVTESGTVKVSYPIYIGMIPYWWNVQEDVTWKSLLELAEKDPDNNYIYTTYGPDFEGEIEACFSFSEAKSRSLLVVVPASYSDFTGVDTSTQSVDTSAFAKWTQVLYPNDGDHAVVYNIYVYNIPLIQVDQCMTFEFEEE